MQSDIQLTQRSSTSLTLAVEVITGKKLLSNSAFDVDTTRAITNAYLFIGNNVPNRTNLHTIGVVSV